MSAPYQEGGENPEEHWMPDQVRHDGVGYLFAGLILYINLYHEITKV